MIQKKKKAMFIKMFEVAFPLLLENEIAQRATIEEDLSQAEHIDMQ